MTASDRSPGREVDGQDLAARRVFRRFAPLPVTLVVLTLGLIVLGATTRLMGAGISCPDWPLCNGKVIPEFEGVVFYEWFHRMVAGSVSTVFLVQLGFILWHPVLRSRLLGPALFAVVALAGQIVLGALTVLKMLQFQIVTMHLATGTALYAMFIVMMLVSLREAGGWSPAPTSGRLRVFGIVTAVAVYLQILLGGLVATKYASWACPDWPTCQGMWFPPMVGFVGIHMTHRYGAYLVALLVVGLGTAVWRHSDVHVRLAGRVAIAVVLAQVVLGIVNVLLHIPVPVSAAHNGLAEILLAVAIALAYGLAARPAATVSSMAQLDAPLAAPVMS
jgi:cytochrome c oxidase assembly protein subunit 15